MTTAFAADLDSTAVDFANCEADRWVIRAITSDRADRARADWSLSVSAPAGTSAPAVAAVGTLSVVVGGEIENRAEVAAAAGLDVNTRTADLIAHLYRSAATEHLARLAGEFCAIVLDAEKRLVWAIRDQLGMHPLYYTRVDKAVAFSPSLGDLSRSPGVSRAIDPAILAEYLLRTYGSAEETVFRQIRRVPAGSIARFAADSVRIERYWDPAPDNAPIEWLRDDELPQFGEVFERNVTRTLGRSRTGVFLSGGLDSVAVAARATRIAHRHQTSAPLGLSLAFPEPADEAAIQSAVARQLGLPHVLVGLNEASGRQGLLQSALEMGATWPTPMLTVWNPAYTHLAGVAARSGCDSILTGRGGDEWLVLGRPYAADLLRRGNLAGIYRLLINQRRSGAPGSARSLAGLVLGYGVRPIAAHWFARMAPQRWHRYHEERAAQETPPWLLADTVVHRDVRARAAARRVPLPAPHGYCVRACKEVLTHPVIAYDLEESFEFSRRAGVRVRHPFWQAELVDFLFRFPPAALNQPRRNKWLVRDELARDFPELGFDRQKKVMAAEVFRSIVAREAPAQWRRLGGLDTLADLGIVEPRRIAEISPRWLAAPSHDDAGRLWSLMNLESWARAQLVH